MNNDFTPPVAALLRARVVRRLQELGFPPGASDNDLIADEVAGAMSLVEIWCHRDDIPPGLYAVVVDMAAGNVLKCKRPCQAEGGDGASFPVKRLSEGDQSVEFAVPDDANGFDALIQQLTIPDKALLARYRKLSW